MPIYEYVCNKCKQQFEYLKSYGDDDLSVACPQCESGDVRKLFSPFASPGGSQGGSCRSEGRPSSFG